MNPGIVQGYIRFGSVPHSILTYLHDHGPSLASQIKVAEQRQVSATIIRLRKAGLIKVVGRQSKVGMRSHRVFDLAHSDTPALDEARHPPMTDTERRRVQRARAKIKVSSVFDFRGSIPLSPVAPPGPSRASRSTGKTSAPTCAP